MDETRLTIMLGLAAQIADVHLEGVGGRREVESPHLVQQPRAFEHLLRVLEEDGEQGELGARQADATAAAGDLAGAWVQGEIGEGQLFGGLGGFRLGTGTTSQGAQAGQQLVQAKGLTM